MNQKNNYRTCIGGIILLVLSIIGLLSGLGTNISTVVQMLKYSGPTAIVSAVSMIANTLLSSGALIAFCLLLTLKKHNKILTIVALAAAAIIFVLRIPGNISTVITYALHIPQQIVHGLAFLLANLAYIAFWASVAFLCLKATGKEPASATKLKLLPCIVYLAYTLFSVFSSIAIYLVQPNFDSSRVILMLTTAFSSLVGNALPLVCWFLICGWIVDPTEKKPTPKQPAQQPPQGYYPPQQPTYQAPQQNQAPQQPNYQPPQYR